MKLVVCNPSSKVQTDQHRKIKTILLIDDDKDDHELFLDAVSETFPEIKLFSATNGNAALDQLRSGEHGAIDLILLDVYMPGMTGWETLQLLKHEVSSANIPVIMLSTVQTSDYTEQALKMGASAYISKPAKYTHILQLIRILVELPRHDLPNIAKAYKPH